MKTDRLLEAVFNAGAKLTGAKQFERGAFSGTTRNLIITVAVLAALVLVGYLR